MQKFEASLLDTFYHFWHTYADRKNGEETIHDILHFFDQDASAIGTGEHELAANFEEVITNFSDDFKEFSKPLKIDFFGVTAKMLTPESGFVEAQGNFELDANDGSKLNFYLRFTNVFVLKEGRWLLVHTHISFPSHEQDVGKAFPINALIAKNKRLEKLVAQRTKALEEKTELLAKEQEKTEQLLFNILPKKIAEELREKGKVEAQQFTEVSILFTDFISFTQASEKMTATELVQEIGICFEAFDATCDRFNIEKIKGIGDAYMAAGGLPLPYKEAVGNTVLAALDMQQFIIQRKATLQAAGKPFFEMRVGIHTGPVVAGIVGFKKFQYDVWGDTVNTASRMESTCEAGRVNISQKTYELLKNDERFSFENRGKVIVKGKSKKMTMYFVNKVDAAN